MIWIKKTHSDILHEEECLPEFDRILVLLGLAESRSEAQKLLKNNAVDIRDAFCHDWWRKVSLKEEVPKGEPFLIRKGKSVWQISTVMIPVSGQTLNFWGPWIEGDEFPWKPVWLWKIHDKIGDLWFKFLDKFNIPW